MSIQKLCNPQRLTSAFSALRFDLQATLMNQIQRFDRVPRLNHTRDVDLARTLADHLDVDIPLRQRREHPTSYTNHMMHLFSNQGQDGHVAVY